MNTIAWLASIPATLWLAVYTYNTLSIQPLFVALLGIMLIELFWVALSIHDDVRIMSGNDND
jgi:hypothetical protein